MKNFTENIFLSILLLSLAFPFTVTRDVLAAQMPDIPSDPLDMKYRHHTSLLKYTVESVQEQISSGTLTSDQIKSYYNLLSYVQQYLTYISTKKDPESYVDPLGRFGVKSTINSLSFSVGFSGGSFTAKSNNGEILSGTIKRKPPGVSSDFDAAYVLLVNGKIAISGSYYDVTYNEIAQVIGVSLTDFLTGSSAFYYPKALEAGGMPASYWSKTDKRCRVDFSISQLKNDVNKVLDTKLKYDLKKETASGTPHSADLDYILAFHDESEFPKECDINGDYGLECRPVIPRCMEDESWENRH